MLDYRTASEKPRRARPHERPRVIWLVFLAGVILVLAAQVLNPDLWKGLARLSAGADADGLGQTDWPPARRPFGLAQGDAAPGGEDGAAASPKESELRAVSGLTPEQVELVKDNRPFRQAESGVWLQLLQVLHETDVAELERQSLGLARRDELVRQSSAYRGELVTLRGTLRRAVRVAAPSNPWGQEHYYQTWLQPADDPSSPVVVYCLGLPEGFPLGMDISEKVQLTGFHFKLSAYKGAKSLHTAPTLAARTVQWVPKPPIAEESEPPSLSQFALIVVGVLVLGVGTAVILYTRARSNRRRATAGPVDFAAVEEAEGGGQGPPGDSDTSP